MRISGFSFARNAQKLYYPLDAAIRSILPICDEFIIAIGKGDPDDYTRKMVEEIGDSKIKIVETEWTDRAELKGYVHGQQTNIALKQCTGDWCFYIQADEVVHEKFLPNIRSRCEQLLDDREVQGLLFKYKHFWGDYNHYIVSHAWYPREIRIIRNFDGIKSWQSAQSFRKNGEKIRVAEVDAEIFHYGWVRPPHLMNKKRREFAETHRGTEWVRQNYAHEPEEFSYGSLRKLNTYDQEQPQVMEEWIRKFNWADKLDFKGSSAVKHKHDRMKYRILTLIEQRLLGGRQLGGFKNYILLKDR